jgi:hypothetical protein
VIVTTVFTWRRHLDSGPGDDEAGGLVGDGDVDAGELGEAAEAVHEGVAVAEELVRGLGDAAVAR